MSNYENEMIKENIFDLWVEYLELDVVVANSAEEAQKIHPCGGSLDFKLYDNWVSRPDLVSVTYLGDVVGEPDDDIYPGAIICASFNAG